MKHEYINRDRSTITFDIKDNTCTISGGYYMRLGGELENLSFIDPSGGPFISIGTNLKDFIGQDFIVDKIEREYDKIVLKQDY